MFPTFISILDIQSWWEVPSIAHFCSLFRISFNLLDFDIEELEEALLADGTEERAASLLTDLIVRLLCGCLRNKDISAFNYQMYLRRLFRQKCQETGRYNPFNTDIDFQFLPLRTKVEILYALCDFRLDSEDVFDLFKNLEAESLRVEPLGWDDNASAYWYFYGTRLYREDYKPKSKGKKRKGKDSEKRKKTFGVGFYDEDDTERVWQVVCFTQSDWKGLTEKFKNSTTKEEQDLFKSLSENFIPEIPRLFQERERQQRKRLLESVPRRISNRVQERTKQKDDIEVLASRKPSESDKEQDTVKEGEQLKEEAIKNRNNRAKRRSLRRSKSNSSGSSENEAADQVFSSGEDNMPVRRRNIVRDTSVSQESKHSISANEDEQSVLPTDEEPLLKTTGRKTNNSLACATGQILIPETAEPANSTRKKIKTSQIFGQSHEVIQTDMYKVLEQLKAHEDAWPFMDPVEEEYAPNYYTVIRRPMDLQRMEERLDCGHYTDFSMFKADFKLIVNNCRLYNGHNNEYTVMVDNLQAAFDRLTEKYLDHMSSSDEEIAVEFQVPESSYKRKKRKSSEEHTKKKKRSHHSDRKSRQTIDDDRNIEDSKTESKRHKRKRSSKNEASSNDGLEKSPKKDKEKHKRKRRKREDGSPKKEKHSHDSENTGHSRKKHSKKHSKEKKLSRAERKYKQKKRRDKANKRLLNKSLSTESLESPNRSRSATPLPSIRTLSPSPTPSPPPSPQPVQEVDFYKDKYDKIKERRRQTVKDEWDLLDDNKLKACGKSKSNLLIQEKDKNQKLRETIEKLKAKNEKYKQKSRADDIFTTKASKVDSIKDNNNDEDNSKSVDQYEFIDDKDDSEESQKSHNSKMNEKSKKPSIAKNESATEALEQAVKDISKWLDEGPKITDLRPNNTSPSTTSSSTVINDDTEITVKPENDSSQSDKEKGSSKKDIKKRLLLKDSNKMTSRRREIQRTIDRLQPGKGKGNLIGTIQQPAPKEEIIPLGPHNKPREAKGNVTSTKDEGSPKLSLGSVLTSVGFKLGSHHQFVNHEEKPTQNSTDNEVVDIPEVMSPAKEEIIVKPEERDNSVQDEQVTTSTQVTQAQLQEKATPNLSAWFKAFGAPKSGSNKKKTDDLEQEEKLDIPSSDLKSVPTNTTLKQDVPVVEDTSTADEGESPTPNIILGSRQRRTSTGSSVSERSSFSQDLDSPRHQISHPSPLIQSPSSPRMDEFQKAAYVALNGTIRAGFYQDTASIKSSPEKSCSPREAPQSPYSPYTQHVYATGSNSNVKNPQSPNYFGEAHNKSPLPTYGLNQPPPYYDSSKITQLSKTPRPHDDYTALGPDSPYQQQSSPFTNNPFSPGHSPHSRHSQHSPYSHVQHSPQTFAAPAQTQPLDVRTMEKATVFPVKKRGYNESDTIDSKLSQNSAQLVSDNISAIKYAIPKQTLPHDTQNKVATEYIYKETLQNETFSSSSLSNHPLSSATVPNPEINQNPGDLINMGYNNKGQDPSFKLPNVDMINMGYLHQDNLLNKRLENEGIDSTTKLNRASLAHSGTNKPYDSFNVSMNMAYPGHLSGTLSKPDSSTITIPCKSQQYAEIPIDCHKETHKNTFSSTCDTESERVQSNFQHPVSISSSSNSGNYNSWKMDSNPKKVHLNPLSYQNIIYSNDNIEINKLKTNANLSINIPNPNIPIHTDKINHNLLTAYNIPTAKVQEFSINNQIVSSDIRIPNPRAAMDITCNLKSNNSQANKKDQNLQAIPKKDFTSVSNDTVHNLSTTVNPVNYKSPYSGHSSLPMESTLRTISNIPQMLDQYNNDERLLSSYQSPVSLYHDKTLQMTHLYNKNVSSAAQVVSSASNLALFSQSSIAAALGKDITRVTNEMSQPRPAHQVIQESEKKGKSRKKKPATVIKQTMQGYQSAYSIKPPHAFSSSETSLGSKTNNVVPGSAFNFGPSPSGMGLGTSIYGDQSGFLEDFRNTTANQLMAANYIAAVQQRSNSEANTEKVAKPAHQNSHVSTGTYPFIGHQVQPTYPFVGMDASSPLYQQYLQRHQEELLRQTGAQMMGLYPPGYPATLGIRQPYDPMNRPSWL